MVITWHLNLARFEKQFHQMSIQKRATMNESLMHNQQSHQNWWSRTRKYDHAIMLRFLHYSNFFNGFLTFDLDSSFNKWALLTCRRSVKRISWNKVVLLHFCDKTLPFSKTVLGFLSLVWWESQFTVESRSHVLKIFSEFGSIVNCLFTYVWCNEGSFDH